MVSFLCGEEIKVGEERLSVEVVDTPETRAKGLMGREHLAEGRGMLFVYPAPEQLNFWMKNTRIPLSIAFFDETKRLINMTDMDPPQAGQPLTIYRSEGPALYALEVPQGWFAKHKIKPGINFSFLDP